MATRSKSPTVRVRSLKTMAKRAANAHLKRRR